MTSKIIFVLAIATLMSNTAIGQVRIPADSLKKHVYFLASDSLEGRGLSTPSGLKAATYIADYFQRLGVEPLESGYLHPFYSRYGSTMLTGNNVVGIIEGNDAILKHEYILLGAHYDHISYMFKDGEKIIYNGADDNASGTAAVIELGRALVQNKDKLKRSIVLVAFDGEESGLLGSYKFVEQQTLPIDSIKLMISIDMIGRFAESESLTMKAMGTLIGGEEVLMRLAEQHDINIKKTGTEVSVRTDSKPFGDMTIPALHATSGIVGPYHKPEDDRETIDYDGMEKISTLLYDLTLEMANIESLEPTKELLNVEKSAGLPFFRYGASGSLGRSFHSYPDAFYNGKRRFSYEIGAISQIKITRNVSLQPEVVYTSTASELSSGNFRLHSISVPVSLILATGMDKSSRQRTFARFGAYYAYHFAGRSGSMPVDFTQDIEQIETGIVYGVGLEVMSIIIAVNFNHGLSNISKDKSESELRNRVAFFSMAYLF
jgi:aminopeptidase YwaD